MFVSGILPKAKRDAVRALFGSGLSDYEIARRAGVNRGTVQRWRLHGIPKPMKTPVVEPAAWDRVRSSGYAYLLGLCLGDG